MEENKQQIEVREIGPRKPKLQPPAKKTFEGFRQSRSLPVAWKTIWSTRSTILNILEILGDDCTAKDSLVEVCDCRVLPDIAENARVETTSNSSQQQNSSDSHLAYQTSQNPIAYMNFYKGKEKDAEGVFPTDLSTSGDKF